MRILVTGAAGFIGSHLCELLLTNGFEVVGVDNFDNYYSKSIKENNIESIKANKDFKFYELDVRDRDSIFEIFKANNPKKVVHLAAKPGVRYSIGRAPLYYDINVNGTINMLDASVKYKIDNFIFASTSSVYGNSVSIKLKESLKCDKPLAPYPATKIACELLGYSYHNTYGLNFTALRFFSVYGPRGRPDMMPFKIIDSAYKGKSLTLFDGGKMYRDWTYVDDIVNGIHLALMKNQKYEVINLGRGDSISMSEVTSTIEVLTGKEVNKIVSPAPSSEPKRTQADISKAKDILGYKPNISFEEGFTLMLKWYNAYQK